MALPTNESFASVKSQETDYGCDQGLLQRAPVTTNVHPLETSERTYRQRQEEHQMNFAVKAYGLGFGLHLKHERAAVGCPSVGHMGCLPRSNALIDALTGRDLDLEFDDILGRDSMAVVNPHSVMENQQKIKLFRS